MATDPKVVRAQGIFDRKNAHNATLARIREERGIAPAPGETIAAGAMIAGAVTAIGAAAVGLISLARGTPSRPGTAGHGPTRPTPEG